MLLYPLPILLNSQCAKLLSLLLFKDLITVNMNTSPGGEAELCLSTKRSKGSRGSVHTGGSTLVSNDDY